MENKNIKGKWNFGEGEGQMRRWENTTEMMASAGVPTHGPLSP